MTNLHLTLDESQSTLHTSASIGEDGRVNINVRHRKPPLSLFRTQTFESTASDFAEAIPLLENEADYGTIIDSPPPPPLNIVIQIVGSRGDVQPFVALGLHLKNKYSHRVRIATHAIFQSLVEDNGLEFFNIGGNPEELMAFMVRNPGLLPSYDSLASGEVKRQRRNIYGILKGCWRSCIEQGKGMGSEDPLARPFIADAIIANPPGFAHIHCAQKLGIPLHLMFTMPYSRTDAFPHPLANIRESDLGRGTNRLSFALIERLTWYGLGDLINKFREKSLGLAPLNLAWGSSMITRLKIPYNYCWSPTLLPRPKDWGPNLAVTGFCFLDTASPLKPPTDLMDFICSGDPPIYIGFGSIVVDNPQAMTEMVLGAVQKAGVRALLSKGWGGLGTNNIELPGNVFLLGNIPHSWLFQHVSAVVHHGGAGTTAAGLAAGKPTVVVPFFGDQPFWGDLVANVGAGPRPIPYSKQSAEKLASQIREALHPEVKLRARHLQLKLQEEDGRENGARNFHRLLGTESSRCMVTPERHAVWLVKGKAIRLSAMAASVLLDQGALRTEELSLFRQKEYAVDGFPPDPVTGGALAFVGSFRDIIYETVDLTLKVTKAASKSPSSISTSNPPPTSTSSTAPSAPPPFNSNSPSTSAHLSTPTSNVPNQEQIDSSPAKEVSITKAAANGIVNVSKAILSTPMHFSMGIARGFQSIPIAYGDPTVRAPEQVTGLLKGLEVGSKELAYGFYDGVAGVVTQPLHGAQADGAVGLAKGLGRGLGGLILKPGAGIFGLPAYALQGVTQEMRNLFGGDYEKRIKWCRLAQGRQEMQDVGEEERERISRSWESVLAVPRVTSLAME